MHFRAKRPRDTQTVRQTYKQADGQTDRQTDRQTDKADILIPWVCN